MATTQQQQQEQGSVSKPEKREPAFVKVDHLKPGTTGHTQSCRRAALPLRTSAIPSFPSALSETTPPPSSSPLATIKLT